jgi:hypothetical protein
VVRRPSVKNIGLRYPLKISIDFDAFSHGQILSKIWLCEQLEPYLEPANLFILGGWYNVLGFMLQVRRPNYYLSITNVDQDAKAVVAADKVTDAWPEVTNVATNANDMTWNLTKDDVVINCSVEHFTNQTWFDRVPVGTLCCIQSSDVTNPKKPWLITSPNPDIQTFISRFPMTETLFLGTKHFQYCNWGYDRFMLIARK